MKAKLIIVLVLATASLAEYHLPILAVERIAEIGEDGEPQGPRSN